MTKHIVHVIQSERNENGLASKVVENVFSSLKSSHLFLALFRQSHTGVFSACKQLNFCGVAYLFRTLFVNSFTSVNQCRRAAKQASVSKVSGCSPDRILLGSSLWFTLAQKPEVLR